MEGQGYWFRSNKLYELDGGKHITHIIRNPSIFGFTQENIKDEYRKWGEKIGFEGKARKALIIKACENGWIRIREYIRPRYYWSIQYYSFDNRQDELCSLFSLLIDDANLLSVDSTIVLTDFWDGSQKHYLNSGSSSMSILKSKSDKQDITEAKRFLKM
jgi:hypothetical protein